MSWHSVKTPAGKSAMVDFSKVMYISDSGDNGSTIHFQFESINASGKLVPKALKVTESIDTLGALLKVRRLLR
ncbi:hypothetical protein OIU34_02290 [Pararhizobium sp. BT-229]|uniref:hypothetical protein n=1 Tax=Pararhizobium sp. BT-229 TaxID=2986923 RepID=UPI0021F7CA57|nr:hypothetical protein [Pararhizobium sp. BT-229]MCV9960716.1 hypothetical protein [Pararhizobium sp. BT-229]